MKITLNICVLVTAMALFGHPAVAENCALTPLENKAVKVITGLQRQPLWRDFPARYVFTVREYEAPTNGFIVVSGKDREKLLSQGLGKACEDRTLLEMPMPMVREHKRFYPSCSPVSFNEGCLEIPAYLRMFSTLNKIIGSIGMERSHFQMANEALGNIGYTFEQMNIYHAIHEMFHDYQAEHKYQTANRGADYATCVEQNPEWVKTLENEKRWWAKNFAAIHRNKDNPSALKALLKEYYNSVRPRFGSYPDCNQAFARYQFHEGVAHFVGSLALIRSGLATDADLARIDRNYYKVPFEVHNVMWVYASGGGLSWLLYYLMGDKFIEHVEQSQTPYDIGLYNF